MSTTWEELDRAKVARSLWMARALPAILYCSESMVLTGATVGKLERIQNIIARFITQVPEGSTNGVALMNVGLMPIKYRLWQRKASYYWKLVNISDQVMMALLKDMEEDDP